MSRIVENWRIFCEMEQIEKEQGSPPELVFITMEDGSTHAFNACSKCAQLAKSHMDEMAQEQVEIEAQKGHKVFETREDIENRGNPELVKRSKEPIMKKAEEPQPEQEPPKDEVMDLLRGIAGSVNQLSGNVNDLTERVARLEDGPPKRRSKN